MKKNFNYWIFNILFIILILILDIPMSTNADISAEISSPIKGEIVDIWIEEDRCFFRIEISESKNISKWKDEIIDTHIFFYIEETEMYKDQPSSMGWKIGNQINTTIYNQGDEDSTWYWINIEPKSEINYAKSKSTSTESNSLDFSLISIVTIILLLIIMIIIIFTYKYQKKEK